jgi:RNA recognition motif-containing protein
MAKRLYVGNLSFNAKNADLETLFAAFGSVRNAQVVMEPGSDRSRGFGFVEMDRDTEAQAAITGLNDQEYDGRRLVVNEARPRESRGGSRGGGGGGGYRSRY